VAAVHPRRGRCIRRWYACGRPLAELPANLGREGAERKSSARVRCMNEGIVAGGGPRLRLGGNRYPMANRRESSSSVRCAGTTIPSAIDRRPRCAQWAIRAYGLVQALFENLRQTRALHRILEPRIDGSTFAGKRACATGSRRHLRRLENTYFGSSPNPRRRARESAAPCPRSPDIGFAHRPIN